jgi:hypothetical protein
MSPFEEDFFSFSNSILNSYSWILGEVIISDNKLVKLISQIVSTCCTSMTIVYSEEGASWPLIHLLKLRLDNIKNNTDSILIIVPYNTLMGVGRVAAYDAILLACKLGRMI